MVIGAGSSGAEIAVDLADAGAEVSIAVRTPPQIVVRELGPLLNQVIAIALPYQARMAQHMRREFQARHRGDLAHDRVRRSQRQARARAREKQRLPIGVGDLRALHEPLLEDLAYERVQGNLAQ